MSQPTTWRIRVWDGYSNNVYYRQGTYHEVTQHLRHLPPGYIWSAD